MKREIYGLWYKHPSNLITTPQMALMTRKEGIEAYGLYMHFADTLHSVGGFIEYDFNDICLMFTDACLMSDHIELVLQGSY